MCPTLNRATLRGPMSLDRHRVVEAQAGEVLDAVLGGEEVVVHVGAVVGTVGVDHEAESEGGVEARFVHARMDTLHLHRERFRPAADLLGRAASRALGQQSRRCPRAGR